MGHSGLRCCETLPVSHDNIADEATAHERSKRAERVDGRDDEETTMPSALEQDDDETDKTEKNEKKGEKKNSPSIQEHHFCRYCTGSESGDPKQEMPLGKSLFPTPS